MRLTGFGDARILKQFHFGTKGTSAAKAASGKQIVCGTAEVDLIPICGSLKPRLSKPNEALLSISVNPSSLDLSEELSLTGFQDSAILKSRAVSRLHVCEAISHGRASHRDIVVDPLGAAAIQATPKAPTSQVPVKV